MDISSLLELYLSLTNERGVYSEMEEKRIKVEITIKESTYNTLKKIADFYTISYLFEDDINIEHTVEDIIKAALKEYLGRYMKLNSEKEHWLHTIQNNKQYQLKNRFKELLRNHRHNNTQKWLKEQTGLPNSTISQILSNNHEMSLRHFLLLWSVFEYPPIEQILYFEKK